LPVPFTAYDGGLWPGPPPTIGVAGRVGPAGESVTEPNDGGLVFSMISEKDTPPFELLAVGLLKGRGSERAVPEVVEETLMRNLHHCENSKRRKYNAIVMPLVGLEPIGI
jgi:hypothetical protein